MPSASKTARALRNYRSQLRRTLETGHATEHSYRPALQNLIESIAGEDIRALNEPKRIECGAPDFVVAKHHTPIGHVECKDISSDLNQLESDEQIVRYREGLPNFILTNYLEFRLYSDGTQQRLVQVGKLDEEDQLSFNHADDEEALSLFESFFASESPPISNSQELAERMAAKAKLLRDGVLQILEHEDKKGPEHGLFIAYRETLISNLNHDEFADLQAQTASYGLFAARCMYENRLRKKTRNPFTREAATFTDTTPFLKKTFNQLAGPGMDDRLAWIVDEIAALLDNADIKTILQDFARRTGREDPIIHFYETFLRSYDPTLRERRGVYYTPEFVVQYIVQSVDILLQEHINLSHGLATTSEDESSGNKKEVIILDPSAGTGTFLREVIEHIRSTVGQRGLQGTWQGYVRDHLIPRLFGFELLMAPYTICHLNLALALQDEELSDKFLDSSKERVGVFLTNALEKAHEGTTGALFAHEIAQEAAGADAIKREEPVMVVIGNPPYSGHSANTGEWIAKLLRGHDGTKESANYFEVDGEPLNEKNPKWLNDDYVKFIRFAQWRIEQTGEGVLGFVTNHSYLSNPTFRGMRQSLLEAFDTIYILDLHGNTRSKERAPGGEKDENVFDIQQGVAIGLFVKKSETNSSLARIFHAHLWGLRDYKYDWLASNDVRSTEWTELSPKSPQYFFVPYDDSLASEYYQGISLDKIFPINSVGMITARDKLTIHWNPENARNLAKDFASYHSEEAREKYHLGSDVRDWKVKWAQEDIESHLASGGSPIRVMYRPFDVRYTYYTGKTKGFICMPRPKVMGHMLAGPNLGLCVGRAGHVVGSETWDVAFASEYLTDFNLFRRGGNCLFPLYVYRTRSQNHHRTMPVTSKCAPNLDASFIQALSTACGLQYVEDSSGDLESSFGPEDVFHYIYGVLYWPGFRHRYGEFLSMDFPCIPVQIGQPLFSNLTRFGRALSDLHLMRTKPQITPSFPLGGDNYVRKVSYNDARGRIYINERQHFDGIELSSWKFTIGGYAPLEKWLKERVGRELSFSDVEQYSQICGIIKQTIQLMNEIDSTVESLGGWPQSSSLTT